MRLGQVIGTVVATQKDEGLVGSKLLVVQEMLPDGTLTDTYAVAIDTVGAGKGEVVLCVSGSSARLTQRTRNTPVDTAIIAIIDSVEVHGRVTFQKAKQ
jgi:microcompartment protein CcmK/EutM